MELLFLGCSDDQGVPRVGCDCDVCLAARRMDSRNHRTGPSLVLRYGPSYGQRVVLIDAAPEFRLQATRQGVGQVDALLLTHTHDVHVLGFGAVLRAQREAGRPVQVHAPDPVLEGVRERFGYLWADKTFRRTLQPQPVEQAVDLWGLEARPLRVDHGIGGTAYGYTLSRGRARVAYVSDMLRATAEIRQLLAGLDLLVLGASHYYEGIDIWKRSVMDITYALDLIREVAPARAILTHLSHTVDYEAISGRLPEGVSLAYDGLSVEVLE